MKADFSEIPAPEGARRLVRRHLGVCETAAARLGSSGDREALRDLRVELHRLKCFIRDYRGLLLPLPSGLEKDLKELASGTNSARDTEAGISLLNAFASKAGRNEKVSLLGAARLLEARGIRPGKGFAAEIRGRLSVLAGRLRPCLAAGQARAGDSLAAVNWKLIRKHAKRLRAELLEIKKLSEGTKIHHSRRLAKKLRYILEPQALADRRAAGFVEKIVSLQFLLGRIHDIQVLCRLLGRRAWKGGDKYRAARAVKFVKKKETGYFRKLQKTWLKDGGRVFFWKLKRYSRQ